MTSSGLAQLLNFTNGQKIPHCAGEVRDGEAAESASGSFQLPYVADENADEDPELKVSTSTDSAAARRLKEAFLGPGKQVRQFWPVFQYPQHARMLRLFETTLVCLEAGAPILTNLRLA